MQWLLIGIAAFVGVGFFIRWMTEAEPKEIRKIVSFLIILVLILLAGWLLLTGKIAAMGAALAAAVPFLVRVMKLGFLWPILRRIFASSRKRAQPGSFGNNTAGAGSSSEIRTEFLHMVLDLETGQMRGGVVSGPYAGPILTAWDLTTCSRFMLTVAVQPTKAGRFWKPILTVVPIVPDGRAGARKITVKMVRMTEETTAITMSKAEMAKGVQAHLA